jgi:hypothetical protein
MNKQPLPLDAVPDEQILPASLPGLPRELKWRIFADPQLTYQNKWQLARSCRGFYDLVRDDLLKPKAYASGVIPLGMLDAPIFKSHPLNFHLLCDVLKRFRRVESTFKLPYLDDRLVWPLFALTRDRVALDVAVEGQPRQRDLNGYSPLYFIVLSGDLELTEQWIKDYYPEFTPDDEPELLLAAMASGNEDLPRFLINVHHYPLNFGIESPAYNQTFGWRTLEFGCRSLFWEIVAPNLDLYLDKKYHATYPGYAALYGHWGFYDEIMARGFESTCELRQIAVRAAARDDKNRFMELIKEFEDERLKDELDFNDDEITPDSENYDLFQRYLTLRSAYVYACKGGQIDIVDYIEELHLITLDGFKSREWGLQGYYLPYYINGIGFAALHGQIELINHFFKKYDSLFEEDVKGQAPTIYYFAAMYGDWNKHMLLINTYRDGNLYDFYKEYDPLDRAIESGHIYFVQRLAVPGTLRRFSDSHSNGFIINAEASGNRALLRWVEAQVEPGKKEQELFRLNDSLAESAKRVEEIGEMEESQDVYASSEKSSFHIL